MTDQHKTPVGIDAIAFSGPASFISMEDLAAARNINPDKYLIGLGQHKMSIVSPCEDTVTLAVAAGKKALDTFAIDPASIGTLIVGTETGIDHSKPVAVYVHELLGLDQNCRTFETKHACLGATAGLTTSIDWIASGRARGKKALVIAADVATYGAHSAGEPTQGAGAVAMVISASPRLLDIHTPYIGDYTKQVMDFWRPLYARHPIVDGHFSIDCYLEALKYARQAALSDNPSLPARHAWLYHVPFVKMAKKAHQRELELTLGRSLSPDNAEDNDTLSDSYNRLTAPYLKLNAQVGNIYTGSLFLSLIDWLRQPSCAMPGHTASLFSYGSGCGATWFMGQVAEQASQYCDVIDPQPALDMRQKLDIQTYEEWLAHHDKLLSDEPLAPRDFGLRSGLYYLGTQDHQRIYDWIN